MSRVRRGFQRLQEASNGEVRQSLLDKCSSGTLLETPQVEESFIWLYSPATSFIGEFPVRIAGRLGHDVKGRLTVFRDQRVDVRQMCNAVVRVFGDSGDDHSGIAVADENGAGQVVAIQQCHDVANMRVQPYVFGELAGVAFQSRQRRDDHSSPRLLQSGATKSHVAAVCSAPWINTIGGPALMAILGPQQAAQ